MKPWFPANKRGPKLKHNAVKSRLESDSELGTTHKVEEDWPSQCFYLGALKELIFLLELRPGQTN